MTRLTDPSTISVGQALATRTSISSPSAMKFGHRIIAPPQEIRSMRVRIQDMGRGARVAKVSLDESPFPSHTIMEKWWIEGWTGHSSR